MDFIVILIYKQFHKSSLNKYLSQAKLEQHFSKIFTPDFEQFLFEIFFTKTSSAGQ